MYGRMVVILGSARMVAAMLNGRPFG